MPIVTIKVLRTERIGGGDEWDRDEHTLLVRYDGRSDQFKYSTGLAFEGFVNPADWMQCAGLDVQTADAGLEDFASCYGESVEDCRDDFAPIERYAARVKRLFGADVDGLSDWACEERRMDLKLRAGQEVSFGFADGAHQKQLFRM
jgi:hypothetical protein